MFHTPMQMLTHTMLFPLPLSFLFPIVPPASNSCHLWTEKNEPTQLSFFLLLRVGAAQKVRLLVASQILPYVPSSKAFLSLLSGDLSKGE